MLENFRASVLKLNYFNLNFKLLKINLHTQFFIISCSFYIKLSMHDVFYRNFK